MPEVTISQKGWVVIPAEIRRNHNWKPGDKLVVVDYGESVSLHSVMKDPVEESFGLFKKKGGGPSLLDILKAERASERRRDKARGLR